MNDDNKPKPHPSDKLEKLQERLNSPHENFALRGRKDLLQKNYSLDDDWTKNDDKPILGNIVPPKRMSIFTKLLIVAATFFVAASAYGGYVFLSQSSPVENSEEIDIKILAPVSIGAGEEYSFDILIQNNNPVPLQTVDLIIEYPEGSKAAGDLKTAQVRTREYLGDIDSGEIVKRKQTVALFGPEGEEKEIEARIEYRLPETSAIFERKKSFDVALQSSPIRLVVDTVKEHIVGQEINFEITLTSNSNETLSDVMLTAEYPFGFTLTESSQKPQNAKKNVWTFEELKPKEIKTISLTGDLQGQNEEERVFHFNAGLADEKNPA